MHARARRAVGAGPACCLLLVAGGMRAQAADVLPRIERLDPRLDALVPPGTEIEKVAEGLSWAEGPLWNAATEELYFSDVEANRLLAWKAPGTVRTVLERSGYTGAGPFTGREPGSNGLALDPRGRLVFCQHGERRISRLEHDGTRTVVVDRYQGKRLNSPNDLVYSRAGDLYFTDPPFGLPRTFDDPAKELPFSGVYRLSAAGELALLSAELAGPNGIGLSPDERTLYVANNDPARPVWMAYELRPDGSLGPGRVLFDAQPFTATRKGFPDGLKVAPSGHLFAAGPQGIYVLTPAGEHLGTLVFGQLTANCAFGDSGRTLYVTADGEIHRLRLGPPGPGPAREGGGRGEEENRSRAGLEPGGPGARLERRSLRRGSRTGAGPRACRRRP